MERKTFTPTVQLKDETPGQVIAKFATLNVIDSDGDVTLPNAFGEQPVRMQPYNHDTWSLPIGKGTIHEEGDAAIANLLINLDLGQQHYSALKFDIDHGPPQIEWSYVFEPLETEDGEFQGQQVRFLKKIKVHSVDPVFLGAGIGTGTVSVKSKNETFADHAERVLADVQAFITRSGELAALREKDGRALGFDNQTRLASLLTAMQDAKAGIDALVTLPPAEADSPEGWRAVKELVARYQAAVQEYEAVKELAAPPSSAPVRSAATVLRLAELSQRRREYAYIN